MYLWPFQSQHDDAVRFHCSTGNGSPSLLMTLYERALACPATKHSVLIWSSYLDFVLQHADSLTVRPLNGTPTSAASPIAAR